ncbi:hypothetical protein JCM16358_06690 [Halanaerocella petrolearia]
MKIKDKIFLGTVAGIGANLIKNILGYLMYLLNISQHLTWQLAASTYFPKTEVNGLPALIIGAFNDFSIAIILGVVTTYILYYTGTDHYLIKGLITVTLAWLLIHGAGLKLGIANIKSTHPSTNLVHLVEHLVLGLFTAWLAIRYGEETIRRRE